MPKSTETMPTGEVQEAINEILPRLDLRQTYNSGKQIECGDVTIYAQDSDTILVTKSVSDSSETPRASLISHGGNGGYPVISETLPPELQDKYEPMPIHDLLTALLVVDSAKAQHEREQSAVQQSFVERFGHFLRPHD